MSDGYNYGDIEPKERCPYCNAICIADFCDIGVGMIQCGPYHCESCGASEIGAYDKARLLIEIEKKTGWYRPDSAPGSSANVDAAGNHIRYFEADTLYRQSLGVAPRYDKHGKLKS